MRTCLILKVVELFYNKDNFSSIISVLKRSLGLEAHCSGFCYFFLHKTSPWSFHSVTIDERSFITTFLLLMLKNIIQDDESQSKVSCKKTPERLSTFWHDLNMCLFCHLIAILHTFHSFYFCPKSSIFVNSVLVQNCNIQIFKKISNLGEKIEKVKFCQKGRSFKTK